MHRNTITVNDTLRLCICNAFEVEKLVPRKHKPALTTTCDGQSAARSEARKRCCVPLSKTCALP